MKKLLAVFFALCMLLSLSSVAFARYNYISAFGFSGEIGSTSVYGEAFTDLNDEYNSKTVISIERASEAGGTFRYYSTLASKKSTSISYLTSGEKSGLSSSYVYRLKAEVFVYDENGDEVEYDFAYIE